MALLKSGIVDGRFWRKFIGIEGVVTEMLGVDPGKVAKLQVFIIVGNPGSAAYFEPFLRYLDDKLEGHAEILVPTHAGHDQAPTNSGKLWTLEEQIQHKMAVMMQHVLLPGKAPVVVLGHSIGAHMMLDAIQRLERQTAGHPGIPPIIKLVGLMPFLETDFRVFRQRCLRLAAPCYEAIGWLAVLLSWLPHWLAEGILRNSSKDRLDPCAVRVTRQLMFRPSIRNNFFLAMHEFKDLSNPARWHMLQDFGRRLAVVCCPNDTWMSREMYDRMHDSVPGIQATWEDDLTHAFVVSVAQSLKVAGIVATMAREALSSHLGGHLGEAVAQQQPVGTTKGAVPLPGTGFESTAAAAAAAVASTADPQFNGLCTLTDPAIAHITSAAPSGTEQEAHDSGRTTGVVASFARNGEDAGVGQGGDLAGHGDAGPAAGSDVSGARRRMTASRC